MRGPRPESQATTAKLLLLLIAFGWGFNWPLTRIALEEISPWTVRLAGIGLGAAILIALAKLTGRSLHIPPGWPRFQIVLAGLFNVGVFNILSAFAQLGSATSRVIIIAYSMPIWAALFARFALGERLDVLRGIALVLCGLGLTVLIWPLADGGIPAALLFALATALSWAIGTVYMKRTKVNAEPLAIAAWQVASSWLLILICHSVFEGMPRIWPLSGLAAFALAYNGLIGMGLGYFLWFAVVERLPATTASLGALLVPVVGITASVLVLGDRPTWTDLFGFALIFAAAACVLLQPAAKMPAPEAPSA